MPVIDAARPAPSATVPATASLAAAASAARPRVGEPTCVAFSPSAGPLRHSGTTSYEIDLAPLLAAAAA